MVFSQDGLDVGDVIRRAERYELVQIEPTESEEIKYRCRLQLCRLRSNESCIVWVVSRCSPVSDCTRRARELACTVIGWFFRFCLRLRQSSLYWIICRIGRKWNCSVSSESIELMTPRTTLFSNLIGLEVLLRLRLRRRWKPDSMHFYFFSQPTTGC